MTQTSRGKEQEEQEGITQQQEVEVLLKVGGLAEEW